jgi:hypothetical protein
MRILRYRELLEQARSVTPTFPTLLRGVIIIAACMVVVGGLFLLDKNFRAKHAALAPSGTAISHDNTPGKNQAVNSSQPHSKAQKPNASVASTPQISAAVKPSAILDLTSWKLTLPIGKSHDPDEITQPQLANYSLPPYFHVNASRNGVQFQAPVGGVTTSGSKFPRSELREMTTDGTQEASWSTAQETSTLTIRESIDHLPAKRPELVAAQIHGPSAYVILVRLNGNKLFVEGSGGANLGDLNANYKLGTTYMLQITAQSGHIFVSYNGVRKVDYKNSSAGNYFKAGCYTQSNATYGDNTSSYGQTTIYRISVSHV